MHDNSRYRLSFSTGGLFLPASVELAEMYEQLGDWAAVKNAAYDQGLTGFQTKSSSTRTIRELVTRLASLDDEERSVLLSGGNAEQSALLWLALCRTYPFIHDFAIEVVGERLANFRTDLSYDHFDAYVASKAQWNEDLNGLSATTLKKLRQILFRYMREAGILVAGDRIAPYLLPGSVRLLLERQDAAELRLFPGVA